MVIVIAIIVLLVGLTVALISGLRRGSENRTTEQLLKQLEMAYDEWKAAAEREVSYGKTDEPQIGVRYDILQQAVASGNEHEPTDALLDALRSNAQSKAILATISTDLLKAPTSAHPETAVTDAWGAEIVTVFPGRKWLQGDPYPRDADGTIQTEFETAFGVCQNARLRFVSAGSDGRLGIVNPTTGVADYDAADNVYSSPLEAP